MADKDFVVKNGIRTVGNSIVANSSQVAINSNLVINTASGLMANGSFGSNGQIIYSNGSSVYWNTAPQAVNTDFRYVYTNTITFSGNLVISNTINANGSVGVNAATSHSSQKFDQVLTSGGPGQNAYWATPAYVNLSASYTYSNTFQFTNTVTHSGPLVLDNTLVANGYSGSAGQVLSSNGSGAYWTTLTSSSGGQNTHVQFNDSGSTFGTAGFTFNKTNNTAFIGNILYIGASGQVNSTNFNGTANNASYLGGTAAASYLNTGGTYTLTGGWTYNATTTFAAGISLGGTQGTSGQALLSGGNGVAPYWGSVVSSVSASSPLSISGTSSSPTVTHSTSGVSATSYTMANISVDSYGHVTSASSVGTSSSVQFGSFGVGTSATGTSGQIVATNNITAYYSDRRLKENIKRIENALDKIDMLSGVYFNSNDLAETFGYTDRSEQVGTIAQEVQAVLPHAVKPAPFDTEYIDGVPHSKSGENYLTVQYEKIVPLLIEGIRELRKELNDIKARG